MLDRTIAPKSEKLSALKLLDAESVKLDNEIPLDIVSGLNLELLKVDFIFEAGSWCETKALSAVLTNKMMNEGTISMTNFQIAEKFDYYGAYIDFATTKHWSCISIYCLNKHLEKCLEIVNEIINDSVFPEKAFETILTNSKHNFVISNEKTSFLANRKLSLDMYGKNHPYSNYREANHYNEIELDDLKSFYKNHYKGRLKRVIASGNVEQKSINLINKHFGSMNINRDKISEFSYNIEASDQKYSFLEKDNAQQSSVVKALRVFNKTNPDYYMLSFLSVVLGGYFGSRLMQNLREEKGYTYGVHSYINSLKYDAYLCVSTDVANDVSVDANIEIDKEILRLKNEKITEKELSLVKNYFIGDLYRNLDNPFALADSLKYNMVYDFNLSYYNQMTEKILEISSSELHYFANKYLIEDDFYTVICGKK